ncbi:GCN5 family acetyltransferase [Pseudomonas putida]|nr:GCN5 family acetyltransferase [Pseudomonas putida]
MLTIRPATSADAQVAYDIRREAVRHHCIGAYPAEQMLAWTAGTAEDGYASLMASHFYMGCIEGEPVATGMLDVNAREIGAIFVLPGYKQQGLGKQMLAFLEALARNLGLAQVNLDATLNAAAFYRQCGYVGEATALYHSPRGIDLACVPMTKVLV